MIQYKVVLEQYHICTVVFTGKLFLYKAYTASQTKQNFLTIHNILNVSFFLFYSAVLDLYR